MISIDTEARAKINLFLNVSGKDSRNYHLIETIFQAIDLSDKISIEITDSGETELEITGKYKSILCPSNKNLVVLAAGLFFEKTGIENPGLKIMLKKNIPVSAGLGGGSSDAASTLIALNTLFSKPLTGDQLHILGSELGSDINFFFTGGTAVGSGRGEIITPISLDLPGQFVIIYPGIEISAGEAYENLEKKVLTNPKNNYIIINLLKNINKSKLFEIAKNDLQPYLVKKYPELSELITRLQRSGAGIAMVSGSGSSVFGYFETAPDLKKIEDLSKDYDFYITKPSWGVAKR